MACSRRGDLERKSIRTGDSMKRIYLIGIGVLLTVAVLCTGCKQYTETEESTLIPDLIDQQETPVPAPDPPKRSEPEEPTSEQSEKLPPQVTHQNRREAIAAVGKEYEGRIDSTVLTEMIAHEQGSPSIDFELFETDQQAYVTKVRALFEDRLPFRSEGSLIGPKAPSYEKACDYIRAEFAGCIGKKMDSETLEEYLTLMKADIAQQNTVPYEKNPQKAFDNCRRMIWDLCECTTENTPYFKTHK